MRVETPQEIAEEEIIYDVTEILRGMEEEERGKRAKGIELVEKRGKEDNMLEKESDEEIHLKSET